MAVSSRRSTPESASSPIASSNGPSKTSTRRLHQVEQLARASTGVCLADLHQLLHDRRIRLPGAAVRPTRVLVKLGLAVLLEPIDPLMGGLAGYAEAFGELANGVIVQLLVFEESLSLFAHGNTFPGHGHLLYSGKCYPCP